MNMAGDAPFATSLGPQPGNAFYLSFIAQLWTAAAEVSEHTLANR